MSDVLGRIIDTKRDEVSALKSRLSVAELTGMIRDQSPPRDFTAALVEASAAGYGLIAEVKKASPSKGVIRADFNPPELARAYDCLLYTSPSPRDKRQSRMPSSA